MAPTALQAQLKYLNEASHLLAASAPSTSSHLQSRCSALIFDNEIDQPESRKQHICGACGNIMVLGWSGMLEIETLRPKKRKSDGKPQADQGKVQDSKAVVLTCDSCGRSTRNSINTTARKSPRINATLIRKGPKSTSAVQPLGISKLGSFPSHTLIPSAAETNTLSANASSKKRAKARKQTGLQSLLAKNKEASSRAGGFGLDLLDLMKKA